MSTVRLVNFEELFKNSRGEILPATEDLTRKSVVQEHIKRVFLSDSTVSFKAACGCGYMKGNFYEGMECPRCKETVQTAFAGDLEYSLWLQVPSFAPPVLQPRAYLLLDKWMGTYSGERILKMLLGYGEQELPDAITSWYTPGWQSFYENFDKLMHFLLNDFRLFQRVGYRTYNPWISEFLRLNRDAMFTTVFPILNSTCHLITYSGELKHVDETAQYVVQMIIDLSLAQYRYDHSPKDDSFINKTLGGIYETYLSYVNMIINTKLCSVRNPKKGFIRKQGMGFRCHFSFRAVVVPINEPHMGDEIHLPWSIVVECLKLEIINVLVNRKGLDVYSAQMRMRHVTQAYDQEIHDIIKTLIYECPYKGLPLIINRNPSLVLGAEQLVFMTKVLPYENVIGISPLIVPAPNGDLQNRVSRTME